MESHAPHAFPKTVMHDAGCTKVMNLSDPNDDNITRLAEQWAFVDQTVSEQYGRTLKEGV